MVPVVVSLALATHGCGGHTGIPSIDGHDAGREGLDAYPDPAFCWQPGTMCDDETICTMGMVCRSVEVGTTGGICDRETRLLANFHSTRTWADFSCTVAEVYDNRIVFSEDRCEGSHIVYLALGDFPVPIEVGDHLTVHANSGDLEFWHSQLRISREGRLLFVGEQGNRWGYFAEDREGVAIRMVDAGCGMRTPDASFIKLALEATLPGGQRIVLGSGEAAELHLDAGDYFLVAANVEEWIDIGWGAAPQYFMVLAAGR